MRLLIQADALLMILIRSDGMTDRAHQADVHAELFWNRGPCFMPKQWYCSQIAKGYNMKSMLVFQTDFTYKEAAVSSMYGIVKRVDRELEIYDSTHEIPNYDIWSASYRLFQPLKFWPEGTVFVSVVDPGVGTQRRASIAETKNGYYIVTPDNGTLSHVAEIYGIRRVIEIDVAKHRLKGLGTEHIEVFHGRDVFAYNAARLASGQLAIDDFGSSYDPADIICFDWNRPKHEAGILSGTLEIFDAGFGNGWTNIPFRWVQSYLQTTVVQITIYHKNRICYFAILPIHATYGESDTHKVLLYQNEYGNISIAINQGSFYKQYSLGFGPDYHVEIRREEL